MASILGADATTREQTWPMATAHAMGRGPQSASVSLTCSKYVLQSQWLAKY